MNLDEQLIRSAHDLAAEVSPPVPDPLALGSQAVARRRRRVAITTGVAAAALVIAAVVVPEIAAQRSSPGPLEPPRPLPVPDAPAWVSGGQVHLGDKVLQVTSGSAARFALTATGVVWAGESDPSGTGDTNLYWQTLEGAPYRLTDEPWRLFTTDPAGDQGSVRAEPGRLFREGRLSPDGRWFITSTGYEAGLRAVLLDTATGRQVPLDLPDLIRGAYSDPWGWSSPDVLMIELMTTDGSDDTAVEPELWACRVSDGTCESLPDAAPVLPW